MADGRATERPPTFQPGPPIPPAYGRTAALALGIGLFGGFAFGLYALGVFAFGWPAARFAPVVHAHGQAQVLGLAGLMILAVGGILLPGFWGAKLPRPGRIPAGGLAVALGLVAELIGRPLDPGALRAVVLVLAALLVPAGFIWGGLALVRLPRKKGGAPGAWELLVLLGVLCLLLSLALRAWLLLAAALGGQAADDARLWGALLALEVDGFLLATTSGVQLRLLPSLGRTGTPPAWLAPLGITLLVPAVAARALGAALGEPFWLGVGGALLPLAVLALFAASGLLQPGLAPSMPPGMQALATKLPPRTRWVLRTIWTVLLLGTAGRALGLLSEDTARHALTAAYLMPLILVVGLRMLPRVSAYPIRWPWLSGALIWVGVAGGLLRAFGGQLGMQAGWQLAWVGSLVLVLAVAAFALLAWSPWGVPRNVPRSPEVVAAYRGAGRKPPA